MHTHLKIKTKQGTLFMGQPDKQEEYDQMFKLRKQVYVLEKGYIPDNGQEKDIDQHDKDNECTYYIAVLKDKVVGTIRVINTEMLPTEKDYFSFERPEEVKKMKNIVEIGRIISRPYKITGIRLPRNIIILGLLYVFMKDALIKDIEGGYGSMKTSAFQKLKKNMIPMHRIKNYSLKYNSQKTDDPLQNFFSEEDPVVPLYFKTHEVKPVFEIFFETKKFFEWLDPYTLRFLGNKPNFFDKIKMFFMTKFS